MTGRQGRRRRKLLDDLKERRGYSHLKEDRGSKKRVGCPCGENGGQPSGKDCER